jgi:hypothetical protein
MSDVEISWVAGLLEGEGSFGLGAIKSTGVRQIRISCSMTDEDTIQRLMMLTGGGNYNLEGRRDPRRVERSKPLYCWVIGKRADALELMRSIRPYMGQRRGAKIDELLQYAEENPPRNHRKGQSIPHGTRNGYRWHECRCEECKEAVNEYARRYRARKASAGDAMD